MESTKSTGGVIGIIVVLIVIVVGGIFFWGSRVSPAREKALQEKIRAEEQAKMDAQSNDADNITAEVDALGDFDTNMDLPDLSN